MPEDIRLVWDDATVEIWARDSLASRKVMDRFAGVIAVAMKRLIPVSPVYPVYARKGATVTGGRRHAGDFPLRPSGYMRSSVRQDRQADGSIHIGPTASYSAFVNDGTRPHLIMSHGPWPLRNRASGQVFGRLVHHPGTRGVHFVERSARVIDGETVHA